MWRRQISRDFLESSESERTNEKIQNFGPRNLDGREDAPKDIQNLVRKSPLQKKPVCVSGFESPPEKAVDVRAEVEVALADEPGASDALSRLGVVSHHDQVLLCIRGDESQIGIIHQEFDGVNVHRLLILKELNGSK